MQDIELVSSGFVVCDEPRAISTALMANSTSEPMKSYRITQILGNDFYKVGDRVIMAGEGAKMKLRGNPTEYWLFDINAVIGKVEG